MLMDYSNGAQTKFIDYLHKKLVLQVNCTKEIMYRGYRYKRLNILESAQQIVEEIFVK